jgi:outer membrane immunogenic protein
MGHPFLAGIAAAALLASSALAADMPLKAVAPATAYDWSGLYGGGVAGGAWGTTDSSDPGLGILGILANVPVIQTTSSSGFVGGFEGGSRYQLGKLVVGTEADIAWGKVDGTSTTSFGPASASTLFARSIGANTNWVGTATSTIGIAHDRWLIFGKAGAAYAHTNFTDNWTFAGGLPAFSGTGTTNRVGWTAGTGVEWALWTNWSLKAEYDYLDFGTRAVAINGTVLPTVANFPVSTGLQDTTHINQFKAGLNWHYLSDFW